MNEKVVSKVAYIGLVVFILVSLMMCAARSEANDDTGMNLKQLVIGCFYPEDIKEILQLSFDEVVAVGRSRLSGNEIIVLYNTVDDRYALLMTVDEQVCVLDSGDGKLLVGGRRTSF